MYQYQQTRDASLSAYQYNAQAIHDYEVPEKLPVRARERRSYRPTALRLPFIFTLVFALCVAMGVIIYAMKAMPDSDTSATLSARDAAIFVPTGPTPSPAPTIFRRGMSSEEEPSRSLLKRSVSATTSSVSASALKGVVTSTYVTQMSTPVTVPGTTRTRTTTEYSIGSSGSEVVSFSTLAPTFFVTTIVTTTRVTITLPQTHYTTDNGTVPTSLPVSEFDSTVTLTSTITLGGTVKPITSTSFSTFSSAVTKTVEETQAPVTYLTLGPVTISSVYTVDPPARVEPPVTTVVEKVVDGATYTTIETHAPQTRVVQNQDETTYAVYTPQAVVSTVGGSVSYLVVVTLPTPETQAVSFGAERTVEGQLTTVVGDVVPSGAFRPITMTMASMVGGTMTTSVAEETMVTTGADGVPTTTVTTRTVSSLVGGTATSMVVVTTPQGTSALTFTVAATSQPQSVITLTFAPTSILTTISGKLTTLMSTPSARTITSTGSKSTVSITSVSTRAPEATSGPNLVVTTKSYDINEAQYFVGVFLPLLLCVAFSAFVRIIDTNSKLLQPFAALAQPNGALGRESLTLQFNGLLGWLTPLAALGQGQPVTFISQTILLLSSLMVPLAAEAVGVRLHGTCSITSPRGCAAALGVSTGPAYALIAVISLIIILLLALAFLLRRFETGVVANPWSVVGVASLTSNVDIRILERDGAAMKKAIANKRFKWGYYENHNLNEEYGVILLDESGQGLQGGPAGRYDGDGSFAVDSREGGSVDFAAAGASSHSRYINPFLALTPVWRILFILFLCGLFAIVLYYHLTLKLASGFKAFLDSHSFGVRFLLALLGVAVTFCWVSFFESVACIAPFQAMMRRPQPPERSILVTRTSNGFYGLYRGVQQREPYTFFVALMTCLSEFLPVTLSNVPYTPTQTLDSHIICARLSIVVLGAMVVVMLCSFFLCWPTLPADPRSIAGLMYYVTDSYFVGSLEGASLLSGKEREQRVKELGRRFFYAEDFIGRSGRPHKGGIDSDSTLADNLDNTPTAYAGYQGGW